MADRIRLTLDLFHRLNAELERLCVRRQSGKAETIRFALELLCAASNSIDEGMTVGAWKDEAGNRIERQFVGLI